MFPTPPHTSPHLPQGEFEVGYRITVAARDGKLYVVRNGEVSQNIIQLESPAVGLARMNKDVMVSGFGREP